LRRAATALAAVGLVLFALPASEAEPKREVVIHGAHSGSHLKLGVKKGVLVVKGWMARVKPRGCRFKRYRKVAVCSLRRAREVVVRMGPNNDRVTVVKKLPVPVRAYLGAGSDKMIGNAERDFCYPQGSKRNRCVGGPGNDVCITGNKSSDCVGGPGNDYCRHYNGSDGCWGGPGNDICVMGRNHDGCHGDSGNDRLYGGRDSDRLYGGRGHDYCDGGPGWGKSQACEMGPRR